MIRVAYYAATLLEIGGGLEKYFIETAHDLCERDDIHVDMLTMDDAFNLRYGKLHNLYFGKKFDPRLLYRESYESITARLGRARYLKCPTFKDMTRRMSEYDVVYARNDITEPFFFKFVMGYRRVPPIILGCHIPHVYPQAHRLHAKAHNLLFTTRFYNWLASGVSGFHVINDYTHDFLRRQFPGRRVEKIYNPFDFDAFAANADRHPFPGRFDPARFNIVWVGRLVEQKGVADLVQLVDRINATDAARVAWHVCGDGELRPLIEACRAKWNNLTWHGHVPNQQMAAAYRQANLFVTTAQWESYPYNVLESQALGLPAVAFDIPGCSDMIENGINGYTVRTLEEFGARVRGFVRGEQLPPGGATHLRRKIDRDRIYADLTALFGATAGKPRR